MGRRDEVRCDECGRSVTFKHRGGYQRRSNHDLCQSCWDAALTRMAIAVDDANEQQLEERAASRNEVDDAGR